MSAGPWRAKRTDLAWAAGFFDSSGSICFPHMAGKKRRITYLFVIMPAKDERCAREFVRLFGGHVFRRRRPAPVLSWRCSCRVAERFLRRITPYLRLKGEAARLALMARETVGALGAHPLPPGTHARRQIVRAAVAKLARTGGR